ncbi:MAG TPA: ABC transporter ATP-binding protein [Chloroflexota bacterium]|nr:ABC transporter ATP-binding protein [Chloroflexota bacterium]
MSRAPHPLHVHGPRPGPDLQPPDDVLDAQAPHTHATRDGLDHDDSHARLHELAHGTPILEVEAVTFGYQDGAVALRGLSLAIPKGRRVAVLGANGSGKSTLFLTLNGILRPDAGRVLLGGVPVRYDRAGLNDLRRRVGLVFQDPDSQLFAASVRQDVSFGPINLGLTGAEVRARVEAALADTQIEDLADRPTHLLSYGQKKRVAIAGVLAMDPEVLVADEPTAGLDPEMTLRLLSLLNALHRSGRTVVLSTHDLELAYAWADVALVLRRGELVADGTPARVFQDEELLRRAGLVQPLVLQTFTRLEAAGYFPPGLPAPHSPAELAALVLGQRHAARANDDPVAGVSVFRRDA